MSVVVPVYRTRQALPELVRRLQVALPEIDSAYELIFVDDACPASSRDWLVPLSQRDGRVKLITRRTSQGLHHAMLTGLMASRGLVAAVIRSDLYDPPEALPSLLSSALDTRGAAFGCPMAAPRLSIRGLLSVAEDWLLRRLTDRRLPPGDGLPLAVHSDMLARAFARQLTPRSVPVWLACTPGPVANIDIGAVRGARHTVGEWLRELSVLASDVVRDSR